MQNKVESQFERVLCFETLKSNAKESEESTPLDKKVHQILKDEPTELSRWSALTMLNTAEKTRDFFENRYKMLMTREKLALTQFKSEARVDRELAFKK
jgi:hypothetical protein